MIGLLSPELSHHDRRVGSALGFLNALDVGDPSGAVYRQLHF